MMELKFTLLIFQASWNFIVGKAFISISTRYRLIENVFLNFKIFESNVSLKEALNSSDIVITGVPSKEFKVDTGLLKDGVVAINFSTFKNFNELTIKDKASIYVSSVGKVTVAMLERNLIRLCQYQQ